MKSNQCSAERFFRSAFFCAPLDPALSSRALSSRESNDYVSNDPADWMLRFSGVAQPRTHRLSTTSLARLGWRNALIASVWVASVWVASSLIASALLPNHLLAQDDAVDADKGATAEQIENWIEELQGPQFLLRERAKAKLKQAGVAAYGQLYRARRTNDLEARLTIRDLLAEIKIQWVGPKDSQTVIDLMVDFQSRKLKDRIAIIDRLFWLSTAESWQPLYRIALYDQSPEVGYYAAGRLLQACYLRDGQPNFQVQSDYEMVSVRRYIEIETLLSSDAGWPEKVIAVGFAIGPQKKSLLNVGKLITQAIEMQTNQIGSNVRSRDTKYRRESLLLINQIFYRLIQRLRNELEVDAQQLLADLDKATLLFLDTGQGSSDDIVDPIPVIEMLINASRIDSASQAATKLRPETKPLLGFWKAEVIRLQGAQNQAEDVARQWVQKISSQNEELSAAVDQLKAWRLNHWAAYLLREKLSPKSSLNLRLELAELGLGLEQFEEAGKWASAVFDETQVKRSKLRSAFILAEVARQKKMPSQELLWIDAILKIDPLSATALVRKNEFVRQPDDSGPEWRKMLDIAKGAYRDQYRLGTQMSQSSTPAEANMGRSKMGAAANALAWLLANLEEETDEAMRLANAAVNLEPFNPEFLDTLAFCEYNFGSRQRAIALQKRAVFVAPEDSRKEARLQEYLGNR